MSLAAHKCRNTSFCFASFLLIIYSFSYQLAHAENSSALCKPFRLDKAGATMERIPVWDQADVGICYAESGADLINAYRFSHPAPKGDTRYQDFVAPMAAAIMSCKGPSCSKPPKQGKDGSLSYPFEGGYACDVINYLRDHPACSRKDFASAFGPDNSISIARLAARFRAYQGLLSSDSSDPGLDTSTAFYVAQDAVCDLAQRGFHILLKGSIGVIEKAMGGNILTYFQYLESEACTPENAIPVNVPKCQEVNTSDPKKFAQALHHQFDKELDHAMPMEVSYCSDLFEKGKHYSGIIPNNGIKPLVHSNLCKGNDPDDPEDDAGHSSVLIGRRFNSQNHKCQLLIKNSWGKEWNDKISSDWEHKDGKIWIDEDTFALNLQGYSTLSDAP